MNKLHLLETEHGKRYWRYNDEDSDESRSSHHITSLTCLEEDCEWIGQAWVNGSSAIRCAEEAGDYETKSNLEWAEEMYQVSREDY